MTPSDLPLLDCHAHVAPDMTPAQLRQLDGAHVFAVSRTLTEAAAAAARRPDSTLIWGIGVHPGLPAARRQFDPAQFARLLPSFALVGEIGLDGSAADLPGQTTLLKTVLQLCADQPVLISLHSARATQQVTDLVLGHPHPGLILHWYLGDPEQQRAAADAGAYFSVNNAMPDATLATLPQQQVLPETDFVRPGRRGHRPGDTAALINRLAQLWGTTPDQARHHCWANLRRIAVRSGALDRLPEETAQQLLEL
jgi:TatD DNase family protein